ncbi:terminal ear1 homolog [Olea europaea subsp. europaea]|uniref:Terminal ear1 homolog n=1 Tax=Olea europaea subsp. europaea TaxID=158383 RepID=A0A8S0U8H6_OLEEU|nr:terminal ear1 homolog [Olea europaea subsp. europaea]
MASPFDPKTLNPFAKEWKPSKSRKRTLFHHSQQSSCPLSLLPPPQEAAQPVLTYSVQLPFYHLPLPAAMSSYQCVIVYDANSQPQPFHQPSRFIPFLPDVHFYGENGGSFVEMKKDENDFKNVGSPRVVRSSNSNCATGVKRRTKTFRPVKIDSSRLEWRPKEPVSSPTSPLDFFPSEKTTIMIKNIPNQMRRDDLMDFLDWCCRDYSLEYDFLYLPMDFRTKNNLGYAFVNLATPAAALRIKKILQNYNWGVVGTRESSKKICELTWARIQGRENLIRRFETSIFACDRLEFLPVILSPPRNGSSSMSHPVVLGRCIAAK